MNLWNQKKKSVILFSLYVIDCKANVDSAAAEPVHEPEQPPAEPTVVEPPADNNPESDSLENVPQPEETAIDYEASPPDDENGNSLNLCV
jgi:hypothetical protein